MNTDMSNVKCLIFRDKQDHCVLNIIRFLNKHVAKKYYKIALQRNNFIHADTLDRCIDFCNARASKYNIIDRSDYCSSD